MTPIHEPGQMPELKPCPFCGGEVDLAECPDSITEIPVEEGRFTIECDNCAFSVPAFYVTKLKAIEFWNSRKNIRNNGPDKIVIDRGDVALVTIQTLKWWLKLVDLNPKDLKPRIEAIIDLYGGSAPQESGE